MIDELRNKVLMVQILTHAKKYSGDTNWLQIKQQENVYMQFYN